MPTLVHAAAPNGNFATSSLTGARTSRNGDSAWKPTSTIRCQATGESSPTMQTASQRPAPSSSTSVHESPHESQEGHEINPCNPIAHSTGAARPGRRQLQTTTRSTSQSIQSRSNWRKPDSEQRRLSRLPGTSCRTPVRRAAAATGIQPVEGTSRLLPVQPQCVTGFLECNPAGMGATATDSPTSVPCATLASNCLCPEQFRLDDSHTWLM